MPQIFSIFVIVTVIAAYDTERALKAATIRDFDDAITRVAFGWSSVDAYYEGSSSSTVIPKVEIPLLVIQAEDDPIAPKEAVPYSLLRDNHHCILVTTPTGGHLGWCSGPQGPRGAPWTDAVVTEYLNAVLKISGGGKVSKEAAEEPAGVWTATTTTHQTP